MHILLTGGTGFIGRHLCQRWRDRHEITVLSRQSAATVNQICGMHVSPLGALSHIAPHTRIDAVINLAGAPIADARWTKRRKRILIDSRYAITRDLVSLIDSLESKPETFISGSAVGYYGDQGRTVVTEDTRPNSEFTHELCAGWESCAKPAEEHSRVIYLRTGLVLGNDGGFLKRLVFPFKLGLGAKLGDGEQYMPWIHIADLAGIIDFVLDNQSVFGPINASAPSPVSNNNFSRVLAQTLGKRCFFRAPAPALKLTLGEMSCLLLTGQRALPQKLVDAGYKFSFTDLETALSDLFH